MSVTPDISVVLISWSPHQDRFKLLQRTVESLRRSTTLPYKLIVVDNGPAYQTQYLSGIGADVHIVNPVNVGPGVARNLGAAKVDTEYLVFLDNDVELAPGWLELSLNTLDKFKDDKVIVQPGRIRPRRPVLNFMDEPIPGYRRYIQVGAWLWVMHTAAFWDVGEFISNDKDPIEDRNWCYRARHKGYSFIWIVSGTCRHIGKHHTFNKTRLLYKGEWLKRADIPQESTT